MSKHEQTGNKTSNSSKFLARTVLQNILGNITIYNEMSNNMLRLKLFTLEVHVEEHTNY